ncbi:phage antirepressor N-terminal domain-containing protein [Lonsdalea quercina]|uniref:phage antirepressor N-terminal domain-containing protein n=1 Tax=Lonsdalea quercina TaxID=71657 RepID=UPI003975ADD5
MASISIIEAVNTTAVQFHGQQIITAMVAGVAYVAMKPVVENIGINWKGQYIKLINQMDKFGCGDISIPTNGGIQKMLCIPLRKLNGWLFSINPAKVRADIRDKLIQYQEECFTALHDYWTKGTATRKELETSVDDRTPLRGIVNRIMGKYGMTYQAVYKLVHKEFGVKHIEELSSKQTAEAIEYLATKAIEGEWMPKEEAKAAPDLTTELNNMAIACLHLDYIYEVWKNELHPSLKMMGSPLAGKLYDRIIDAGAIIATTKGSIEEKTGVKGVARLSGIDS